MISGSGTNQSQVASNVRLFVCSKGHSQCIYLCFQFICYSNERHLNRTLSFAPIAATTVAFVPSIRLLIKCSFSHVHGLRMISSNDAKLNITRSEMENTGIYSISTLLNKTKNRKIHSSAIFRKYHRKRVRNGMFAHLYIYILCGASLTEYGKNV